ncbi:MAG: hypothetical protein PHY31_06940, partial [Smithellaceae bacterium]|nr:hypothetical protein [Smithellaceae bacterium]
MSLPNQSADLSSIIESSQPVAKGAIINALNHIHFTDGHIFVQLHHSQYDEEILVKAHPEPCANDRLSCRWFTEEEDPINLDYYRFMHLMVTDGLSITIVPAALEKMNAELITVKLPEVSHRLNLRKVKRYRCPPLDADLIQNGTLAKCELLDFSSLAFRVRLKDDTIHSFHGLNPAEQANIQIYQDQQLLFSGLCRIIRKMAESGTGEVVLAPINKELRPFPPRLIPNPPIELAPAPLIDFEHPLLGRKVKREVRDISTWGFSVSEPEAESLLIPGLIVSDLTITYAATLNIRCSAQVVERRYTEDKQVICEFVILDMALRDYSSLAQIIFRIKDPYVYISNRVDTDALWEFFFQTGFIYPKKYNIIKGYKEEFKDTYRKLYLEAPNIARHFTYEKDGKLYGHISMVQIYERAWLIHHHAAVPLENRIPGLQVLKHITMFNYGLCHLPSAKMDYVMCYYRPDNKFPSRTFGGFAKEMNDPRICSVDSCAYLTYDREERGSDLPTGWTIEELTAPEARELSLFYRHHSGGLLLDVLGLDRKYMEEGSLEQSYRELGLTRKWNIHSLSLDGKVKAALIVNQSNLGVNLSELLNGITVIVNDPEDLPWTSLCTAISKLSTTYSLQEIP